MPARPQRGPDRPDPDPGAEEVARQVLALPPRPPRSTDLFSSDTVFGERGLYPDGPPMVPAPGPPVDAATLRERTATTLARLDGATGARPPVPVPHDRDATQEPEIAAALAILARTAAAPAAVAFPRRTTARSLRFGTPASAGRVVGPPEPADGTGADAGVRVVNERYRAEHPALLAPSLAHDLLWSPGTAGHAAEALLHALAAIVHLQIVARVPALAHLGTELCRRQNSLAITLCNSRSPGTDRITLVAADGPGTIPGGDPALQTPDFWSIPFAPVADAPAPPLAAEVLVPLLGPDPDGRRAPGSAPPFAYSEAYGRWFAGRLGSDWLAPLDRLRASVALGLVDRTVIEEVAGDDEMVDRLGLDDAFAPWAV
jgi:hypothetical protein